MDKDQLIKKLKEENKILRAENDRLHRKLEKERPMPSGRTR